jgi:hypothetical protein
MPRTLPLPGVPLLLYGKVASGISTFMSLVYGF